MKNPEVSIIIPSYNYEKLIKEAFNSAVNQSFGDFEIIVVDDGSTDNSIEVIKKYQKKYSNIYLFTHKNNENRGLSKTVRLGLKHAKGKYIAFLECDDFWEKDYLSKKIEIFKNYPDVGIIFNDVQEFGDKNRINLLKAYFEDCRAKCKNKTYPSNMNYEMTMLEVISNFSSAMMQKRVFDNLNFDTPIAPYLDWWIFSQITCLYDAYFLSEKLTHLRIHPKSYISSTKNQITIKDKKKMFSKILKLLESFSSQKYKKLQAKILSEKIKKNRIDKRFKSDFIKRFKNKKVFLYGAGSFMSEVLKNYDFSPLKIRGIFDADINKKGGKISGFKIYHKSEIARLKPDAILISVKESEMIYAELLEFVKECNLDIPVITDFFNEMKYNSLNNRNLSLNELLIEMF